MLVVGDLPICWCSLTPELYPCFEAGAASVLDMPGKPVNRRVETTPSGTQCTFDGSKRPTGAELGHGRSQLLVMQLLVSTPMLLCLDDKTLGICR